MPAVAALPNLYFALLENGGGLYVLQQGAVTLLVVLFNGGHRAELSGQLRKALFLGGFGKALVHIGPLVVLPVGGSTQIFRGVPQPFQLLEPHFGVFLLVFGGL